MLSRSQGLQDKHHHFPLISSKSPLHFTTLARAAGEQPPPCHTGSNKGRWVKGFAQEKSHRARNRAAHALPPNAPNPQFLDTTWRFPTSPGSAAGKWLSCHRRQATVQRGPSLPLGGSLGCKEPARTCQMSQKPLLQKTPAHPSSCRTCSSTLAQFEQAPLEERFVKRGSPTHGLAMGQRPGSPCWEVTPATGTGRRRDRRAHGVS